jgi:hypothetical protein
MHKAIKALIATNKKLLNLEILLCYQNVDAIAIVKAKTEQNNESRQPGFLFQLNGEVHTNSIETTSE